MNYMINSESDQVHDTFFTIIIPTRERADTLIHTIESALLQDYSSFEILVSDNASRDDTYAMVSSIRDQRVKYINTGQRVSMSENWEFALNRVNKGWVTIIGDDDAIIPGALAAVNKIIKTSGVEAIRSSGCNYTWPGFNGSPFGSLGLSLKQGLELRDSGHMLQKVIDGDAPYDELPMLYNGGFVSIDLINRVKAVTGKFFLSMTPDVYSGVAFSLCTEKFVYCYEPLAINGVSLHSGGTASFERVKQKRDYDPAKKFWSERNLPFHRDLPLAEGDRPVRSIPVVIYEAYLQASRLHPMKAIQTNHAAQLRLALMISGPDEDEIFNWAKRFAAMHNLDEKRWFGLKLIRPLRGIKQFLRLVYHAKSHYSLKGTSNIPLRNVFEAGIAAGMLKEIRPSALGALRQHFNNRSKLLRIAMKTLRGY
jgi:glycosyltransferase involved in cell wall biosynthesis